MTTVKQLVARIKAASDAYYNTGEPLMTDAEFDALVDELRERDPDNAALAQVGAPVSAGTKVALPYPMMSLDKVKAGTEKWAAKHPGPYVLSDKLDGTSAMLAGGKLYRRGTGKVGADVSHLIPHLMSRKAALTKLVVRGEIVIRKADFDGSVATDARSAVNALVNKKAVADDQVLKAARFVAYEVVVPRMDKAKEFEALKSAGFEVAWHESRSTVDDDFLAAKFAERRRSSEYNVDGVVVQAAGVHELGDKNPTYAFAFKSVQDDQGSSTTVIDVVYESSRDGRLIPRVSFDPIVLDSGVTMRWATAHNARFVQDLGIGPGAQVFVVRSGDVIPKILRVDEPVRAKLPAKEPAWSWDANGVHAVLEELGDTAKIKILLKFVTALGVEFTKEGSLTKLYEAGYDTVRKLLEADPGSVAEIPGFGAVQATKMLDSLAAKVAQADVIDIMVASNAFGSGIGRRKLVALHAAVPDFYKLRGQALEAKVLEAPGFQGKTADKIVNGMDEFDRVVRVLGISLKGRPVCATGVASEGVSRGKVVFSGFRDAELEAAAAAAGFEVATSVSGKTAYVVAADPESGSGKLTKARELGITILSVPDFEKCVSAKNKKN